MTENKVVPKLRFKEFEDDWIRLRLGELLTFKNGLNADKEKYGSGVKFINVLDIIENNFITYNKIIGSVEVTKTEFDKNKVVYGDVLFQRSSETREEVGQANVYLDKEKSAVFGGFVIRGHTKEVYEPLFMNYLFKTWLVRKEITTKSGGSTRYNIGQDTLSNVMIDSTLLPEQQKIADFLSSVDNKLQHLKKKKELLEKYKKGLMQKIFSQEIRFKDDNGNDYPDWEEKYGNELFASISNKNHNSNLPILAISQEYGAVPRDKINYKITVTSNSITSYKVVEKGDFIISLRSFQGGIEYSNYKGICSPAYIILKPIEPIIDYFYKTYLKSFSYIQELTRKLEGIRDGKMISYKYFSEIQLPYPSLPEQLKIADFLSSVDNKIELVDTQITQTESFKKGLLQQMFVAA